MMNVNGFYTFYTECKKVISYEKPTWLSEKNYKNHLDEHDLKLLGKIFKEEARSLEDLGEKQVEELKSDGEIKQKLSFVYKISNLAKSFFAEKSENYQIFESGKKNLLHLQSRLGLEDEQLDVEGFDKKKEVFVEKEMKRSLENTFYCFRDIIFRSIIGNMNSTCLWGCGIIFSSLKKAYNHGGFIKAVPTVLCSTVIAATGLLLGSCRALFLFPKVLFQALYGIWKPQSWIKYTVVEGERRVETGLDRQNKGLVGLWDNLEAANIRILSLLGVV